IDPSTHLPPASLLTGFLPPEDGSGRGLGFVGFNINQKSGLTTGTQIRNVADITFDLGQTLATDLVNDENPGLGIDPNKQALVTIDAGPPTSSVTALPTNSVATFTVAWSGHDDAGGSGIAAFSVYYSDNGGVYKPLVINTSLTSKSFTGQI